MSRPVVGGLLLLALAGCASNDPPTTSLPTAPAAAPAAAPPTVDADALRDEQFMRLVGAGVPATADGPATARRLCEIVRETPMLGGISAYRLTEAGFTDSGTFLFQAIATYCPEVQEALLAGEQPPN